MKPDGHPLVPPAVRPETRWRWAKKNTTAAGTVTSTADAVRYSHCGLYRGTNCCIPYASVNRLLVWMNADAYATSPHAVRKLKNAVTAIPGARRHVFAMTYGEPPDPPATARLIEVLQDVAASGLSELAPAR